MYDGVTVFARGYNANQDMEKKNMHDNQRFHTKICQFRKTITRKNSAL